MFQFEAIRKSKKGKVFFIIPKKNHIEFTYKHFWNYIEIYSYNPLMQVLTFFNSLPAFPFLLQVSIKIRDDKKLEL